MKRGRYIVLEGGDGTGKSTQLKLLLEWLRGCGIDCLLIEEPGGAPMSEALRVLIKDKTIVRDPKTNVLMFMAARVELGPTFDKLKNGAWILSSRSYLSTIAYQGYGEGVDVEKIKQTAALWLPEVYLKPDREIILSLSDPAVNHARLQERNATAAQADTFESKGLEFADRVQQGYVELAQQNNRHLINADRSVEEIASDIRHIVQPLVDDWLAN